MAIGIRDERIFFWERIWIRILILNLKFFESECYSNIQTFLEIWIFFQISNNIRIWKISDLRLIFGFGFVPKKRFVHLYYLFFYSCGSRIPTGWPGFLVLKQGTVNWLFLGVFLMFLACLDHKWWAQFHLGILGPQE